MSAIRWRSVTTRSRNCWRSRMREWTATAINRAPGTWRRRFRFEPGLSGSQHSVTHRTYSSFSRGHRQPQPEKKCDDDFDCSFQRNHNWFTRRWRQAGSDLDLPWWLLHPGILGNRASARSPTPRYQGKAARRRFRQREQRNLTPARSSSAPGQGPGDPQPGPNRNLPSSSRKGALRM
jgi:hypothetical protein